MSVIRQLRERQGWTQRELAVLVGRTQSWVNHIETGRRDTISLEDGVKLAELFKMSPENLETALKNGALPTEADSVRSSTEDPQPAASAA